MKDILKSKLQQDRGFTLTELIAVVVIMMALFAVAGIYAQQWLDKYNAESQIRQMHVALMQARTQAMERNGQATVVLNNGSYQICFTNDSGTTCQTTVTLKYQVYSGVTITMDQRGIISTSTSTTGTEGVLQDIRFHTGSGQPEYDCIQLYATRINIGRWDSVSVQCLPR